MSCLYLCIHAREQSVAQSTSVSSFFLIMFMQLPPTHPNSCSMWSHDWEAGVCFSLSGSVSERVIQTFRKRPDTVWEKPKKNLPKIQAEGRNLWSDCTACVPCVHLKKWFGESVARLLKSARRRSGQEESKGKCNHCYSFHLCETHGQQREH